jgi:hypothetical protein
MRYKTRTLTVLLTLILIAAVGCSRTTSGQRVSQAPTYPPSSTAATTPPPSTTSVAVDATPIPGHPPVTTAGVVAKVDPAAGILTFQDGRTFKLTPQAKVLTPVDPAAVVPGTRVVVRDAMPVAAATAKAAGKRQKMGTVASVDQQQQLVRLTDGSSLRVSPSTNMHMGMRGATIVLTDLKPGDELIIVMADAPPAASATSATTSAQATPGGATVGTSADPSALPRSVVTGAPSDPTDANELMVFREVQAP